jgi:hypothetical protein
MRHRLTLGLMFLGVLVTPILAAGQSPTTRPATQPGTDVASLKRMIVALEDENYQTREASRVALMGLKRTDLENFQKAVKASLPLEPSQVSVLRDIVTQVYLSGETYTAEEGAAGFLGISLANGNRDEDQGLLSIERGIVVAARVPGFCAFRVLQTGDVILAMTTPTRTEFKSPDPNDLFMLVVKTVGAGQTIGFEVLRQGQIINVSLTLDPRPAGIGQLGKIQKFTAIRMEKAEEYWNKEFAPLLSDPVG